METLVPTSSGPARLTLSAAAEPRAILWLGHGAGGGIGAPDLAALAAGLPEHGVTVARFEQPYRVAGKRLGGRPDPLDRAWVESLSAVRDAAGSAPLLVGGRSAGARVACRTATEVEAVAVVCLAFPLHPPASPEKSRLEELLTPSVPVLVLQGERDTFGTAESVAAEAAGSTNVRVVPVPGADHSMKTLKGASVRPAQVLAMIRDEVTRFVGEVVGR